MVEKGCLCVYACMYVCVSVSTCLCVYAEKALKLVCNGEELKIGLGASRTWMTSTSNCSLTSAADTTQFSFSAISEKLGKIKKNETDFITW